MTSEPDEGTEEAGAASKSVGWRALPYLILWGVTLAIYWRVPELGFMAAWDDNFYLAGRPEVEAWFSASWTDRLLTPEIGYPLPVPTFLYYLTHQLPGDWGLPVAHGLNLAGHLVNVALVYRLGRRWLDGRAAAFVAALLWATHPLLVETVCWLTDLKMVLLGTFALGAFLCWERALEGPPGRGWRATSLLLFTGALGCRPEAVVIGPFLLLRSWLDERASVGELRTWGPIAAMAIVSVAYVPVAQLGHTEFMAERGAMESTDADVSVTDRATKMGAVLTVQLSHVGFPVNLHPWYPADGPLRWGQAWIGLALGLLLVGATAWTARRFPETRPGWAIWWLFYLPSSGVVYLARFTADTYMYLPLLGLVFVAVALARRAAAERRIVGLAAVTLAVGTVLFWGAISHVQTLRWRNSLTLWRPVVEAFPDHPKGKWKVAKAYVEAGAAEKGARFYRRAYRQAARQGRLSLQMAAALEESGSPREAASVVVDILSNGEGEPRADRFLVRLVTEYELTFEPDGPAFRSVVAAAERLLERGSGELDASFCRRAAGYFERHYASDVAQKFAACGPEPPR